MRGACGHWAGLSAEELDAEMETREGFLNTLLKTGVTSIPEVNTRDRGLLREAIKPRPQA